MDNPKHDRHILRGNVLLSLLMVTVAGVAQPASVINLDVGADGGLFTVAGSKDSLCPAHDGDFVLILWKYKGGMRVVVVVVDSRKNECKEEKEMRWLK